MSNAAYNRFENTLKDLIECKDSLDEETYKGCNLSEQTAVYQLIRICKEITISYGNSTFDFDENEDTYTLLDEEDDENDENDEDDNES